MLATHLREVSDDEPAPARAGQADLGPQRVLDDATGDGDAVRPRPRPRRPPRGHRLALGQQGRGTRAGEGGMGRTWPHMAARRAASAATSLEQQVIQLEQQVFDLQRALAERNEELAAAREAHRRLMAEINRP
jgi:hypothetical protein